jgi:F-type H+-transporting ATPase subunit b
MGKPKKSLSRGLVSGLALALILAGAICTAATPDRHDANAKALVAGNPRASEAHGSQAGEHESGPPDPLQWKSDLALWTLVVFLVMLVVLWKAAWKPIIQGLDKREKSVADQIAQAERNNQEAKQLLASYQQKLDSAQNEVRAILERARRDAEQAGREMMDKTREEIQREHQKALREIDSAAAVAMKDLAQLSADLAVQLAGKIVRGNLKPVDHAELIEQALRDFRKVKVGSVQ